MNYYGSPRWSGEILDCSLPMTFDTYNKCSYDCLYCFSNYQKMKSLGSRNPSVGNKKFGWTAGKGANYKAKVPLLHINPKTIRTIFEFTSKSAGHTQFRPYIAERVTMQWGGLTDPFDENERRHGVGLEVMRYFRSIDYPICFSTKGTWWTEDERYMELFRGNKNWNVKFSIINLDPLRAKHMERGVDPPESRLRALERIASAGGGGATLRLRPFIFGMTDRNGEHLELIRRASAAGATAVSTEFFCLDSLMNESQAAAYRSMSKIVGYDVYEFYKRNSAHTGYMRLNRNLKAEPMAAMRDETHRAGMRFYVSDAHFKELSDHTCCCGLDGGWKVQCGNFAGALQKAKAAPDRRVAWTDIAPDINRYFGFGWNDATGFNTSSVSRRAMYYKVSMADYIRHIWNDTGSGKNPYRYFGGALKPVGVDEGGDLIYEYQEGRE